MMAPTFCKDCSIKISGFFKKKYTCQLCCNRFCDRCFSKVKEHAGDLSYNLRKLPGQNCLPCLVLCCGRIKREQLFLLENKQLALYLSSRQIPTERCSEKYHLVDLIMDFAEKNGIKSGDDIENDCLHHDHVEELKRKAELLRLQEERSTAGDHFESSEHEETTNGEEYKNRTGNTGGGDGGGGSNTEEAHFSGSTNSNNNDFNDTNEFERNSSDTVDSSDSSLPQSFDTSNNGETTTTPQAPEQQGRNEQTSPNVSTNTSDTNNPSPRHQASGKWRSLEDIQMVEDINILSVLELKQILTANFIDYRGCCEKKELQDKVTMLYESKKNLQGSSDDRDLCKICMDRMIDCIFLDCAHLVACTQCGKNLTECPICRALIVRVVHIFRA